MTIGIYAIFDSRNNECLYVGQSKQIEARWRQHVTKMKNKRKSALKDFVYWYHANDADESILSFEILEECEDNDLVKNILESKWFDELKPRFFGKVPSLSERWSHSEETKKAISDSIKNISKPLDIILPLCDFCKKIQVKRKGLKYCSDLCYKSATKKNIDLDLLKEMYLDRNTSLNEICEYFGVTGGVIVDRLKSIGITNNLASFNRQKDLLDVLTKVKLENLYLKDRLHLREISDMYNSNPGVIRGLLERYGIPRRNRSEAAKVSWEYKERINLKK